MTSAGGILATAGPWAILVGALVGVYMLIARGKLVPRYLVEQRIADKQQLVDYQRETSARALDAIESRERKVELLIDQLSDLVADMRAGRVP